VRVAEDGRRGPEIYARGETGQAMSGASGAAAFELAGAKWRLELRPTQAIAAQSRGQSRTILLAGIGLTLLLAGYLYSGIRRTEVIERRVVQRTAQLSAQVAERKRAEEAARVAEAQYRGIFDNASEGMFRTTLDGHYVMANRALAHIYGYESPERLMSDLADIAFRLYVDPARRDQFIQQVQRDGGIAEFESQVYRRDGRVIWISENAHAVRDAGGAVMYYEGTVIDVTARRAAAETQRREHEELEERVRERTRELALYNGALKAEVAVRKKAEAAAAAANHAKSRFLANMSHEIRTPMNAILGYAQILHRDRSLRDGQREAMRTILSSGNHLLALIDDILDLSKIEAGHVTVATADFDLGRLVDDTAAMFRHKCRQKAIGLHVEAVTPGTVRGDEGKLRQVLINLLGNAVKFTDAGGVTLRVTPGASDNAYHFVVADTGPGIPPDAQLGVFEAFQQASAGIQRGGTGLGLAISRQYVELMGGRLDLESSPGVGSRFSFELELAAAASPADGDEGAGDARQRVGELVRRRGVRALVVDDVPANRGVLAEILAAAGCDVETADSGEAALERVRHGAPDVAFVDVMMPGIDGLETARRMIGHIGAGTTRLVATTASVFAHERARYAAAGFDDVIAKPIRCERVYACLEALLGPDAAGDDDATDAGGDLESLPGHLRRRLASAAELCSITDLKQCVAEIEATAVKAGPLVRKIKRSIAAYDLPAVQKLLAGTAVAS
jgi:PAS domain S-box-containing protein